MRLGVSFSPRRAAARGLDWRRSFRRLLELDLDPVRLSAFWDEVDEGGYRDLDWLLSEAAARRRTVVVTVGMKSQGWPEFYIPARLQPVARPNSDVAKASPALLEATLEFVGSTVERYRRLPAIAAWQIENEPLNPSGPRRWWIGPDAVRREIAAVREADPSRPLVLSVFAHFNRCLDVVSSRHGRRLLWQRASPEAEALRLLMPGDILGLDVYRRIGYRLFGFHLVTRAARDWSRTAGRWRARAEAAGLRCWIMEAQAEPWEPGLPPGAFPSYRPDDLRLIVGRLRDEGFDTVLLWGAEHWLASDAAGDTQWLAAVRSLLEMDGQRPTPPELGQPSAPEPAEPEQRSEQSG